MTTAPQILDDLAAAGVTLEAHGERLRFHPRDQVTPDLLAELRTHKAELLAILTTTVRCPWCRSVDLTDDSRGLRCRSCGRLAWLPTEDGGAVRADCVGERYIDAWPEPVQTTKQQANAIKQQADKQVQRDLRPTRGQSANPGLST